MSLAALQDLFIRHREGATGVWRLGTDPQRTIFLELGKVVFAQSTHPLDKLTTLLVERGKLTQAQLDYALQNLKPGTSIGRNLIEMGFITQRDLLEMARSQVERVVWGALGTPDEKPVFEDRDLDNTVVRLPLDTPFLLLMGVLHITDRERLLQILGPLEQRPDLEGRTLPEMPLPADLAKVVPMLDGQRSLLDLAREAGAEPIRLGAFALFLRELGVARLKLAELSPAPTVPPAPPLVLPPVLAPPILTPFGESLNEPFATLFPEPAPAPAATPAPVPVPPPIPAPVLAPPPVILADPALAAPAPSSLFAAIEAAQRPTVNLDHLSEALDKSAETPEVLDTGAELPPLPSATLRSPDPLRRIQHPRASGTVFLPQVQHEDGGFPIEEEAPRRRTWLWLFLLVLVAGGAWAGWRWTQAPGSHPAPAALPQAPAKPGPKAAEPKVEPPKVEPVRPEGSSSDTVKPTSSKPLDQKVTPTDSNAPDPASRLSTLVKGDWALAMKQGASHRATLAKERWTLRLEVACQTETLAKAVELLKDRHPDVFILPLSMRDGRTCTQVYLGDFASEAEARKAAEGLPAPFLEPGARPKPYLVSAIPDKQ